MSVREKFFKAQMLHPVSEHFDLVNDTLTVTTTGLPNKANVNGDFRKDTLTEIFTPYEKVIEVDGIKLKLGLIKYSATFVNSYDTLIAEEEKVMLLDEQKKRDILWWHVEADRETGNHSKMANIYADVLHDLDLSDAEFLKKYWGDKDRRDLGRKYFDEDRQNIGVKYGFVDFDKEYEIRRK